MFPDFNKNDKNIQDSDKKNFDRNLKLMSLSAAALVALFIYTLYKSSSNIQGSSYYFGLGFLFVMLFLAIGLQFYKDKIRNTLGVGKFEKELQKSRQKSHNTAQAAPLQHESDVIESVESNVKFDDIAGIKSVKEELVEIVDFLNNPKKYKKHGVKLPHGVLLVGPPGVGKTLVAKAVAGEANVPFFYQSGSSFVHIYVGMGAKRVRELFTKAKAHSPSIVFIDEIDAIGKSRTGTRNDEREATLNELLTQMDGFDANSDVIVIAATNKIEVLDSALLRAGRFDRRVHVGLPSLNDRRKIIELYLRDKIYNFDLEKLVAQTAGFSSAALATLINEALLNMIKREGSSIIEDDINIAKNKIQFGKKEHNLLSDDEKGVLAIYQASKAFITKQKVALFDEGIPKSDKSYLSKTELTELVKSYLSGSVGVEVVKGEPYTIFENDLQSAEQLASQMVDKYKMGRDKDVIINEIKDELRSSLSKNSDELIRLKEIMLTNEVITVNDL